MQLSEKTIDKQLDRLYKSYGELSMKTGIGASILRKIVKRQIDKFEKLKEVDSC